MRGLEHILFFFLFAGENSMRGLELVLFFFLFAGVNCVVSLLYFLLLKKKGFENRHFEIRVVVKYPPFGTNIYI